MPDSLTVNSLNRGRFDTDLPAATDQEGLGKDRLILKSAEALVLMTDPLPFRQTHLTHQASVGIPLLEGPEKLPHSGDAVRLAHDLSENAGGLSAGLTHPELFLAELMTIEAAVEAAAAIMEHIAAISARIAHAA